MTDNSRFLYVPASALASRRIIEQSSYTTTPDQSSADATPPCGEAVYKTSLDAEKIKRIDLILQMKQSSDAETVEPSSKETSTVESKKKKARSKSMDRDNTKSEPKGVEEKPQSPKTMDRL